VRIEYASGLLDPLTRPALGPRRRACRTGDLMAEFRQSGCGLALAAKKS
jgi:hypothetical protein